jgi:hypothetical protein
MSAFDPKRTLWQEFSMKKLLQTVTGLIAFSAQAMTQDAPQTQQMPKVKPGPNLMAEKQVIRGQRSTEKLSIGSTMPRSKRFPKRKRVVILGRVSAAARQPRSEKLGLGAWSAWRQQADGCRLLVLSGHFDRVPECPLSGVGPRAWNIHMTSRSWGAFVVPTKR